MIAFSFCFTTEQMQWPSAKFICIARYLSKQGFKREVGSSGLLFMPRQLMILGLVVSPCSASAVCAVCSHSGLCLRVFPWLAGFLSSVDNEQSATCYRSWLQQVSLFECCRASWPRDLWNQNMGKIQHMNSKPGMPAISQRWQHR